MLDKGTVRLTATVKGAVSGGSKPAAAEPKGAGRARHLTSDAHLASVIPRAIAIVGGRATCVVLVPDEALDSAEN